MQTRWFRLMFASFAILLSLIVGGYGQNCKYPSPLNCYTSQEMSNSTASMATLDYELVKQGGNDVRGWMAITPSAKGLTVDFSSMQGAVDTVKFGLWPCHAIPEESGMYYQIFAKPDQSDPASAQVFLNWECAPFDCCFNMADGQITIGPTNMLLASWSTNACLVSQVKIDIKGEYEKVVPKGCDVVNGFAVCKVAFKCAAN
mmetsp:Transcript_16159/g.23449  ORF Transcript_16159/g.23449 Transcript_16159/m.23449 type:complete len:202 (-) Transcript_16159:153-758(-)